jgi:hypothetical protein
MLFQTDPVYEHFVTQGYDATAEAGTMFDDDETRGTVRFADGRSIYYLTSKGWKVSASAAGTKYWRDIDLNAAQDPFYLDAGPGLLDPNAAPVRLDPNAPPGSIVPNAAPAPFDLDAAPDPFDPDAAPDPLFAQ